MKKSWKITLLCAVLAALLCGFAFAAAAPTESGIYNIRIAEPSTTEIVPVGSSQTVTIDGTDYSDFYANAEKLTVNYSGTDGNQYLIFALKPGETVPTAESLIYIDQKQCVSGKASFTVFPSALNVGTINLYVSGTGMSYTRIGSFDYYAAGVTVSGQVKSYNPNNPTTIQLMDGSTVVASTTIEAATGNGQKTQAFSIEKVPAGTYDLVVTKVGHLTYTVKSVVVGDADLDLTAAAGKAYAEIVMLAGDVNGDGSINEADVSVIRYSSNINKATTAAANPIADVNGDGSVNEADVSIVRYSTHINKSAEVNCTVTY